MGQFSRQRWFSRSRSVARDEPITGNRPCGQCGYNLRGLETGSRCPECGLPIPRDSVDHAVTDPAALRSHLASPTLRAGLHLSALSLFAVVPGRILRQIQVLRDDNAFAWWMVCCAFMWAVGAIMSTQRRMDVVLPRLIRARRGIRASQALWIVAYLILWLRIVAGINVSALIAKLETAAEFIAGCGALAMAWYLRRVAEEIETPDAATRLNVALWTLPILTLIVMAFPEKMTILGTVVQGLFLLMWCAAALMYSLGLHGLARYLVWTRRSDDRLAGREERVEAARAEMDREVSAKVRSTRREVQPWEDDPDADIPLD